MTEIPLRFGPHDSYIGVLTRPAGSVAPAGPVHVLFNAGLIHRVGPHRLYVRLARSLAESGEWVFRFDLSGVGDSRLVDAAKDPRAQAQADLEAAMNFLALQFGATQFTLLGICSGAVYSYWTGLADPRVVGILMFDGFWYRTVWTTPIRHWKRLRSLSWRERAEGLARRLRAVVGPRRVERAAAPELSISNSALGNPPREDFEKGMALLVERGVAVMLIYSGSVVDYYSYGRQFRDAFGHHAWCSAVRCELCPAVDHTLTSRQAQETLVALVHEWIPEVNRLARIKN